MKTVGVGIIGASPLSPGWALAAHIPAIQALPDFALRAVSTSRRESADAAANAFDVPAFDNARELINHPAVDLVVVSVKVPDHLSLVLEALDARKMVFSEWPLGANLDEVEKMARRAQDAGVRTVIGLQGRYAPAVRHARDLIATGYVGEVLATTLVGSAMAWGGEAPRARTHYYDIKAGMNVVSVPVMHALEAVTFVLGEFATLSATSSVRRKSVRIIEDGTSISPTAPDHIAISGTLQSGAVASAFYRGAASRGENLRWEINGTEGDLVLTSSDGTMQVTELKLAGGRGDERAVTVIALPADRCVASGDGGPHVSGHGSGLGVNTMLEYAALARDIREGTQSVPDFAYALRRHRLLAALEEAARTGIAQKIA